MFIKLTPWLMLTKYQNKHSDGKYCKQEIFNLVHTIFTLSYITYDFYLQKNFFSILWYGFNNNSKRLKILYLRYATRDTRKFYVLRQFSKIFWSEISQIIWTSKIPTFHTQNIITISLEYQEHRSEEKEENIKKFITFPLFILPR